MASNGRARFVHNLLVRHGAGAGDFLLGHARCLYIVFALLESVPQHETQHGLGGASSQLEEAFPCLLPGFDTGLSLYSAFRDFAPVAEVSPTLARSSRQARCSARAARAS